MRSRARPPPATPIRHHRLVTRNNAPAALSAAKNIADDDDHAAAVFVFRALGNKSRLALMRELLNSEEPMKTKELRHRSRTPGTVQENLYVLKTAGLVDCTGPGHDARWSIVPGSLEKVARLLVG